MPHSRGLSNNPYPESSQPNSSSYFFKIHSNIVHTSTLGLPKGLFPVGVPVKILKALLSFSILTTWPAHTEHKEVIHQTNQTDCTQAQYLTQKKERKKIIRPRVPSGPLSIENGAHGTRNLLLKIQVGEDFA